MEFYHERRGILARYDIEAPLPAAAVLLGRRALLAEYPPTPTRGSPSLFKQGQRVEDPEPQWMGSLPDRQGGRPQPRMILMR
jgi:hypothetical protein